MSILVFQTDDVLWPFQSSLYEMSDFDFLVQHVFAEAMDVLKCCLDAGHAVALVSSCGHYSLTIKLLKHWHIPLHKVRHVSIGVASTLRPALVGLMNFPRRFLFHTLPPDYDCESTFVPIKGLSWSLFWRSVLHL